MNDFQTVAHQARTIATRCGALPLNGNSTVRHYCNAFLSLNIDTDSPRTWIGVHPVSKPWISVLDIDAEGQLNAWVSFVQPAGCNISWIEALAQIYNELPQPRALPQLYYLSIIRFWHDRLAELLNQTITRDAAFDALQESLIAAVAFIAMHHDNDEARELLLQAHSALALANGEIQLDFAAMEQKP